MAKWKPNEKHKKINLVLDLLIAFITLSFSILTFIAWSSAPDRIPTHFNIHGQIDGYGSKNTLFLLVGVAIILILVLNLISRHPEMGNYMAMINEGNKEVQYNMMSTFTKVLNLELALMLMVMQWDIVNSALNNGTGISTMTTLIPVGIMIISSIIYGRWSVKCK